VLSRKRDAVGMPVCHVELMPGEIAPTMVEELRKPPP
jgi:hypothetical protein